MVGLSHAVQSNRVYPHCARAGADPCSNGGADETLFVGPTRRNPRGGRRITLMSIDELETEALKLKPEARARLAERLLDSLEDLSDEENARLWAEEAARRSAAWDASPGAGRPAEAVFRDAKSRLS